MPRESMKDALVRMRADAAEREKRRARAAMESAEAKLAATLPERLAATQAALATALRLPAKVRQEWDPDAQLRALERICWGNN